MTLSKTMKTILHRIFILLVGGAALLSLSLTGWAQTIAPKAATVVQTPATTPASTPEKALPRRQIRPASTPLATVTVVADQTKVAPQVVTIVHRLSGVKMLRFLMRQTGEPGAIYTIDTEAIASDAHASIIAGWALSDGKTIAVRLPQAGAELEFFRALTIPGQPTPGEMSTFIPPGAGEPDLTVITRDGRKLRARYIGLDGQTGLSVLQVNAIIMPPLTDGIIKALTQGQSVQIFAPERTTPAGEGSSRNIYVRVGEVDTKVTELTNTGSGKSQLLTVRGPKLSPLVIGGVACDEAGNTLGIVESVEGDDARIVSADTIRSAAGRVLKQQTSVPRPLLGIVGEPVRLAQRAAFLANGWREDQVSELLQKHLGILLTAVNPGTPAALAKLFPGDVIVRVNQEDIASSEEFSKVLGDAGSGQLVRFMVRRPSAPGPFPIDVKLGGSFDQVFKYRFDFSPVAQRVSGLEGLGLETMTLSPRNLVQLGAENGVLVVAVEPESIAARSGLKEGDVIEAIDGRIVRRGSAALGFQFNRRKKHVLSLVRKREKKQVILEPVE